MQWGLCFLTLPPDGCRVHDARNQSCHFPQFPHKHNYSTTWDAAWQKPNQHFLGQILASQLFFQRRLFDVLYCVLYNGHLCLCVRSIHVWAHWTVKCTKFSFLHMNMKARQQPLKPGLKLPQLAEVASKLEQAQTYTMFSGWKTRWTWLSHTPCCARRI